jgi:glycosyltransferase involved in cell wall biosynthesis
VTPELSVVLPVRNAEATLAEAIESCLEQTWGEFELIVVLNGGEDRSVEIAEQYAKADSRMRLVRSPASEGVAGAMKRGVEEAQGALIARMDADDRSLPTRFERQREFLHAHAEIGVVSGEVRLVNSLGAGMERYVEWVNGLRTSQAVARERFVECPVVQPSLMMRREAIAQAGGYRVMDWAEDHDLFLRMLEKGIQFGKVEELVLDWRDGEGRLTRSHAAYGVDQVWRMKAHHLARVSKIREGGVALCGAGPIGKRLARLLLALGVEVHGFFEVNPKRVGAIIAGVPVASSEELGSRWREAVLLSAVGIAGGRGRVREPAMRAGYAEGEDFFATC